MTRESGTTGVEWWTRDSYLCLEFGREERVEGEHEQWELGVQWVVYHHPLLLLTRGVGWPYTRWLRFLFFLFSLLIFPFTKVSTPRSSWVAVFVCVCVCMCVYALAHVCIVHVCICAVCVCVYNSIINSNCVVQRMHSRGKIPALPHLKYRGKSYTAHKLTINTSDVVGFCYWDNF